THEYRALKRFWKLLLKNQDDVDYHRYYPRINFKYAELSDSEVLDRLFDMSSELKTAYEYYQLLLQMYRKNSCQLLNLLTDTVSWNLPPEMRQALKTIKKHKAEIENSFVLPRLTNGPIEGVNNHIKVIKRIAYGYNNFKHFRLRILLSLKNNVIFFSTYNKKTIRLPSNSLKIIIKILASVLFDKEPKKVVAEKLDFEDAMPRLPYHVEIKTQDYAELKDADVIITAFGDIDASVRTGNRFAEFEINTKNAVEVGKKIKESGFSGVIIDISNPCDAVTSILQETTELPRNQVLGTGTFLDTARMQHVVGDALGQDGRNVEGFVLGEHGNSQFVAWSTVRVNNKPITEFFTEEELEELGKKPAEGGFKVANGKGYTSYAIATCGVKLAQAVLSNAHFF